MEIAKLKKQVEKAREHRDERKIQAGEAVDKYGEAERALAIVQNELDHAESLETARELRAKKSG